MIRPTFSMLAGLLVMTVMVAPVHAQPSAFSGSASSQCVSGVAEGFACENVNLLAHMTRAELGLASGVRLNDIWAWEDPVSSRSFALVGSMAGVTFVDVSAPDAPIVIGNLPRTPGTSTSPWRDMKVIGNMMYVVADGSASAGHGMQIFDLTQLPAATTLPVTFTTTAHYTGIGAAHNVVANEDSDLIIIVGANGSGTTCGGGLHMVDVSDPLNPVFEGCFTDSSSRRGYSHDAQCVIYQGPDAVYQGREICAGYNEDKIVLSDITDRTAPKTVGVASYPGSAYVHQGWFTEDHRYLIQDDELDESGFGHNTWTRIFDVTDLDDPVLVSTFKSPNASIDHNLYVKGDLVFQANYSSGLQILDISDPMTPLRVGYFDTYPADDGVNFNGAWSAYPYLSSGAILVSDRDNGLFVVETAELLLTNVEQISIQPLRSSIDFSWNVASVRGTVAIEVRVGGPLGFRTVGRVSVSEPGTFSFSVADLDPGRYPVQLVVIESDGREMVVADDIVFILPETLVLLEPFPNPALASSRLTFVSRTEQHVRVALFDARGRELQVIFDDVMTAFSEHSVVFRASSLAAGVYYVRATGQDVDAVRTLVITK